MLLALLCKEITQRFSQADSMAGFGLPAETGHCLSVDKTQFRERIPAVHCTEYSAVVSQVGKYQSIRFWYN